jgi:hypothetical protein
VGLDPLRLIEPVLTQERFDFIPDNALVPLFIAALFVLSGDKETVADLESRPLC